MYIHRDCLGFLWCEDNDSAKTPITYRMTTHLFGGVWSPGCANFILRRCASDNYELYDPQTIKTVNNNFYVDDCLKSVPDECQAVRLARDLTDLLRRGGFHLTKWISNSSEVIKSIPESERAKTVTSIDLEKIHCRVNER